MAIDAFVAAVLGVATGSFLLFVVLIVLALPFARPERPFSSGLLRLALMALGISALFALLGGGDDCDCDL